MGCVVKTLDRYFEHVAGPVVDGGGEILKFIGDAMLAIFPVGEAGAEDACRRALAAAKGALTALGRLNEDRAAAGEGALVIGVALHLGEVMHGTSGRGGGWISR